VSGQGTLVRCQSSSSDTLRAFRGANDELRAFSERLLAERGEDANLRVPFLCECADAGCSRIVRLTVSEYDRVHAGERRCAVLPGHERLNGSELVVERQSGYVVIERAASERTDG
jgi:hypothetical protein